MGMNKTSALTISLLLFFTSTFQAHCTTFDVVKQYGAKADGNTDISQALLNAWRDACGTPGSSTILIPNGTYALFPVDLAGPCKGAMALQVDGTLVAPVDPNKHIVDFWVSFTHVDQFTLCGTGTFDGQGALTWQKYNCKERPDCKRLPISLRFNFINNGLVRDVTSLDSKNFHVNVLGCKNLTFQHFTISAPASSQNTDGIHIGRSNGVTIIDSRIGTGDDCISIGDDSQQIYVTRVTCGPGHGISIGSLGKYPKEGPVSGVFVSNCTMLNTDNGVRIKSWPALYSGMASNMHFEDIIMNNVSNPILIDQMYCPWNRCNTQGSSKVKISDVSFKNIRGTSSTPVTVQLICSSGMPCEDVKLEDIELKYTGPEPEKAICNNVEPLISGILPAGC